MKIPIVIRTSPVTAEGCLVIAEFSRNSFKAADESAALHNRESAKGEKPYPTYEARMFQLTPSGNLPLIRQLPLHVPL